MRILDKRLANLTRRELLVRAFLSLKSEIERDTRGFKQEGICGKFKIVHESFNEQGTTWIALYLDNDYDTFWIGDTDANCRQPESAIQRDVLLLSLYPWEKLRLYCESYFFRVIGVL